MTMINWQPIPGYVGRYWASPEGMVRNAKGRLLKHQLDAAGVAYVNLRKNGQYERFDVKFLQYLIFGEGSR